VGNQRNVDRRLLKLAGILGGQVKLAANEVMLLERQIRYLQDLQKDLRSLESKLAAAGIRTTPVKMQLQQLQELTIPQSKKALESGNTALMEKMLAVATKKGLDVLSLIHDENQNLETTTFKPLADPVDKIAIATYENPTTGQYDTIASGPADLIRAMADRMGLSHRPGEEKLVVSNNLVEDAEDDHQEFVDVAKYIQVQKKRKDNYAHTKVLKDRIKTLSLLRDALSTVLNKITPLAKTSAAAQKLWEETNDAISAARKVIRDAEWNLNSGVEITNMDVSTLNYAIRDTRSKLSGVQNALKKLESRPAPTQTTPKPAPSRTHLQLVPKPDEPESSISGWKKVSFKLLMLVAEESGWPMRGNPRIVAGKMFAGYGANIRRNVRVGPDGHAEVYNPKGGEIYGSVSISYLIPMRNLKRNAQEIGKIMRLSNPSPLFDIDYEGEEEKLDKIEEELDVLREKLKKTETDQRLTKKQTAAAVGLGAMMLAAAGAMMAVGSMIGLVVLKKFIPWVRRRSAPAAAEVNLAWREIKAKRKLTKVAKTHLIRAVKLLKTPELAVVIKMSKRLK